MPTKPLYPAYLPTRPDGYAPPIELPLFEGTEPGTRADPAKPSLYKAGSVVRNITPRVGTEISGVQISQLSKHGLDEVALLAAERGVLVFVRPTTGSLPCSHLLTPCSATKTLRMSGSTSNARSSGTMVLSISTRRWATRRVLGLNSMSSMQMKRRM